MPDIGTEAGVLCAEPFLTGASKISVHLWTITWSHAPATIAGDAEALHDMRVAIRRLRSALQNFEGNAELKLVSHEVHCEMKNVRRRLGRLGDTLGAVRDYDVLDGYLQKYAGELMPGAFSEATGLVQLDTYLKQKREKAFTVMIQKLERSTRPGCLQENLARWAHSLSGAFGPQFSVQDAAKRILPVRVDKVLALAPLLDDDNESGHHEVRKALRRLRYTLEIFAPCYGEPVQPYIKGLVSLQDRLGEMQDRTVLSATAQRAFKNETDVPPDGQAFIDFGIQRRAQLLQEVRHAWQMQVQDGFWQRLSTL